MKVVGIKIYDYHFEDGRNVSGRVIHCTSDADSTMEGVSVNSFKLPNEKFGGYDVKLGDEVFASLDKYSRVTEFLKL